MDAKPVICLMGPTASGKTDLALELLQHFPLEIVSVDSAMIYRGMDIGTAKPSLSILKQAPHRLIDIRNPNESYSAGDFRSDAIMAINEIFSKQHIPLLVGGTMLYFYVLQQGIAQLPKANPTLRQQLQKDLKTHGINDLHKRLQRLDPLSAQSIHPNDPQRILRALEVITLSGKPFSLLQLNITVDLPYRFINIGLFPEDRSDLHKKIQQRFQAMLRQGFVEEVRQLLNQYSLDEKMPSLRAVGYRQIWQYLTQQQSYQEMQERAIIATRQLAKRQMTWLRSWKKPIDCFDNTKNQALSTILSRLNALLNAN